MKQEYHEEKAEELADDADLDEYVVQTFSKMYRPGFAIAMGTVSGLLILVATLFLVLKGGETVGQNLQLLSAYFVGYSVTFKGAFIGFANSFVWGFLFGWLFATLRNLALAFYISRVKRKIEMHSFRDFMEHF